MNTDDIWYYARSDGSAVGPFSRTEMVKLARADSIDGETLVWHNEDYEWRPLAKTHIALARNTIEATVDEAAVPEWRVGERFEPIVPPESAEPSVASEEKRRRRAAVERSRAQRQQARPPPAPKPTPTPAPSVPPATDKVDPTSSERVGWAVRRWCARLFDICTIGLVALATLLLILDRFDAGIAGSLIEQLSEPFLVAPAAMLAWIPFEAIAISLFGTTPGKAIWGIRLASIEHSTLGPISSLRRSMAVVFRGMFFGIPPITLLSQGWAMITLLNQGATSWDRNSGSIVEYASLGGRRIMIGLVLLVAAVAGVIDGESWRVVLEAVGEVARML